MEETVDLEEEVEDQLLELQEEIEQVAKVTKVEELAWVEEVDLAVAKVEEEPTEEVLVLEEIEVVVVEEEVEEIH